MKSKIFNILLFTFITTSVFSQGRTVVNVSGTVVNTTSLVDKEMVIDGKTDLHVTATYTPLTNSIINLNSENSWVFFDNIRPQAIIDSVLPNIYINGAQAISKLNVRVSIYRHGAVVIPHSPDFRSLKLYSGTNFTGDTLKLSQFVFNNNLATFDNRTRSFKLRRGYMATLANEADGSGYSRVFIADNADLEVSTMSTYLDKTVSFVRIFPWEWVSKKGWCQTGWGSGGDPITNSNKMNATWFYTWSADNSSRPNQEYVPIRSQQYWPSWTQIKGLNYVSHVMGFNEPDHTEQSNVSVAQAVAQWPEFQKTGLRLGSPACTDFSAWLYPFMDSIKAHNYRVDYVVIHAYWGGYTPSQWYSALKAIHDKTGRPLWIKEWNNGANWTTETWPTSYGDGLAKQLTELKAILNVMDTAHFVERYSIYNWVGSMRMMISDDGWVTPAGENYRDRKAPMAFNRINEVIPTYKFSIVKPTLALTAVNDNAKINLTWTNGDQEFGSEVVVEKKPDGGDYAEVYRSNQTSVMTYNDTHDFTQTGKFIYRTKVLLNNGTEQISNEQSLNVTPGGDIQYGKFNYSNVDWNTIGFKNNYSTIPAVFVGAPTNNNAGVLLTAKVKISSNKLMNFELLPWAYQNVTSLVSEESVPYFIIKPGAYDFGGLKALVSKTTVASTWKTVSFASAFDTIPVVMVSTTSGNNPMPTALRIRNVTKTGFEVKLQKESKISTALVSEIFSYIAVKPGIGTINGNKIIVGRTAENAVGNAVTQYAKVSYGETITNPVFLAQMQTCNDDSVAATLRCRSVLTTEARIFKQREVSMGFTASATETAGYIIINPDVIQGLANPQMPLISVYPNPVKDKLFLVRNSSERIKIDIYNISGLCVYSNWVEGTFVDVSSLNPGYYTLRSSGNTVAKFLKK
ncbi:MAG TPA: glycosyl hydrolase [Paludibacter sp.]|nr:glycosyl hydrolase [Paludibacter sp.]